MNGGRYEFNQLIKYQPELLTAANASVSSHWKQYSSFNLNRSYRDQEKKTKSEDVLLNDLIGVFCEACRLTQSQKESITPFLDRQVKDMSIGDEAWARAPASALCNFLFRSTKGEIRETDQELEERNSLIAQGKKLFKRSSQDVLELARQAGQTVFQKSIDLDYSQFDTHHWNFETHELDPCSFSCQHRNNYDFYKKAIIDIQLLALSTFANELTKSEDEHKALEAYLFKIIITEACPDIKRLPEMKDSQLYRHYASLFDNQSESIQKKIKSFFSH